MLFGLDSIPSTKWCVELLHNPIIHHWKLFKKAMLEIDWSWSASADGSYIPLNVDGKFFKWKLSYKSLLVLHLTSSLKCIFPCFQSLCSACWLTRNSLPQQTDLVNILRVFFFFFASTTKSGWIIFFVTFLCEYPFSEWSRCSCVKIVSVLVSWYDQAATQ